MAEFVIVMQVGMWFGYITFGFLSDRFGRKPCYIAYLMLASLCLFSYGQLHAPHWLLLLGPVLAFFGTGYFTGFATITAEMYPTHIRATAQGFTYNVGRIASAIAPFAIGNMASQHGFRRAFAIAGGAFVLSAMLWIWIPETRSNAVF